MSIRDLVLAPSTFAARMLNPLQSLVAAAARLYVSWQFLNAGYIKITNWTGTEFLFENEYHTPFLSPHDAAIAGTFGELFFPTLVALGLFGRLSALALFCVNIVAVIFVMLTHAWGLGQAALPIERIQLQADHES